MEPIIALVAVTAIIWVVNAVQLKRADGRLLALRGGVLAMFALTGASHFVGMRADLIEMVPAWLPHPDLIVTITGVLELAGAIGMLIRPLLPWAGLGLSLLLAGMFPANVSLALSGAGLPWWDELLPRTVMQLIFLAATVGVTTLSVRARREAIHHPVPENSPAAPDPA